MTVIPPPPAPAAAWPATRRSHPFDETSWAGDIPPSNRPALGNLLTSAGRSFSSLRSSSQRTRDDSEQGVDDRAQGAAEMAALAGDIRMSANAAERVAAGAALLDRKVPGWAERIDLAALSIASCTRCVLGQLAPDVDGCGFDPDFGFDAGDLDRNERVIARLGEYAALDAEWKRVIRERLGDAR
jgi:hypothetical protein